jgi:hypothetical protein
MKYILLLVVGCLVLPACKKKAITYKVNGTVTDQSLAQPLAGATVQLYEMPAGSSAPTNVVATTTTGADGTYHFEFKREKVEKYTIKVSKALYFPVSTQFSAEDLSSSENNQFTHTTTAMSWVRLRFINADADQNLKYIRQQGKNGCAECCPSGEQFIYGAADETIYCINDGNTTYQYYYWILNTPDNGPMSVVTPPFDTVDLVLNY